MSVTVGELQVLLSGDMSRLNRDMDRIDARAGQTERTHSAAWSRIGAIAGTAVKAGAVVATAAVAGLGVAIKKGLDLSSFQQQAQISFATLLGGADKARAYLGDLQQFAASTPFELPGVVQAAQQLLGVGRSAESVIPTLNAWGNASGALGQTQEQFGRTMTAVTQMIGKGKVSAEEMMQITEAGIPIWGLMAQATGKPIAELQKLASEGKLLADDVLPLLEQQMQKNYGGAMEAQAKTLSGVWSTAKDNLNLALADGVKPLAAGLTVLLPTASEKAAEAIRNLGQRGSQGLVNLIKRGQELREEFGPELSQIADMARQKWDQFVDVAKRLGEELAPSLPDVADALLRIAQVGMDVGAGMMPVLRAAISAVGPVSEAVAGSLQIVAGALEAIEPILPAVVTGFLAFQGISAVNGLLTTFAGGVKTVTDRLSTGAINAGVFTEKLTGSAGAGEKVMTGMGGAATALGRLGAALPVVGLAFAAVGYIVESHRREVEADTQAILANLQAQGRGGQEAVDAGKKLQELRDRMASLKEQMEAYPATTATAGKGSAVVGAAARNAAHEHDELASKLRNAKAEYDKIRASMTPVERATQDVTAATKNLILAQDTYGPSSSQATTASEALRRKQAELEQAQRNAENATRLNTDAIVEQATQAMNLANADIGLSNATLGVQSAQARYNEVLANSQSTVAQRQQAENDLASAMTNAAGAAGRKAEADNAGKTPAEIHAASVKAQYDALVAFAAEAGGHVPATVQTLMNSLGSAAVQGGLTAAAMRDMGVSVREIPGEKFVQIDAPTADQQKRIEGLGSVVRTLPDGHVYVFANTADAEAAVTEFVNKRRTITINMRAVMPDLNGAVSGSGRMGSYDSGGYTGNGGKYDVAGIVHKAEFVVDKEKTARFRPLLEAIQSGREIGRDLLPGAGRGRTGGVGGDGALGGRPPKPIVQNVTNRNYTWNGNTREEMSLRHFLDLQRQAEALYG